MPIHAPSVGCLSLLLLLCFTSANAQIQPTRAWLDPRCDSRVSRSFNELRFTSSELRGDYRNPSVPAFLHDVFKRWFNFDLTSVWLDTADRTFQRIAALQRVNEITQAQIGIFCDNQAGPGYRRWQNSLIRHDAAGIIAPEEQIKCSEESLVNAVVWLHWTQVEGLRLPEGLPGHRLEAAIFLCNLATETEIFTLDDLAERFSNMVDLGENVFAVESDSLFEVLGYSLAQIPRLSSLGLAWDEADLNPDYGHANHRIRTAGGGVATLSGAFRETGDGFDSSRRPPGEVLERPERTVYNIESYSGSLVEYGMKKRGFEMYEGTDEEEGRLFWRRFDTVLPEGPTWPTDSENWNDQSTPNSFLPDVLRALTPVAPMGRVRRGASDGAPLLGAWLEDSQQEGNSSAGV